MQTGIPIYDDVNDLLAAIDMDADYTDPDDFLSEITACLS